MSKYFRVSYFDKEDDTDIVYIYNSYNEACGKFYEMVYHLHDWCDWYGWNSVIVTRELNEYTPECDNLLCRNSGIIIKLIEQDCDNCNSKYNKDTLVIPICIDDSGTMFLLPTIPVYYNEFKVGYFMYKDDKFELLQTSDGREVIYPIDDISKLEYDSKYGNLQEALRNAIVEEILN